MNNLISEGQARAITGGRMPLVPIEIDRAIVALRECRTFDEAKYWDNKADAYAAWAKIHRSKEMEKEASALKLHAYRRLYQLSSELRPGGWDVTTRRDGSLGRTMLPGARSVLLESGMSNGQAAAAALLGKMSQPSFDDLCSLPRPPSPTKLMNNHYHDGALFRNTPALSLFASFCRRQSAAEIAKDMDEKDLLYARTWLRGVTEWLDEFEQALPK